MSDKKKTILHVDDDGDILAFISALLADIANVTSVHTAKEARELMTGSSFDLFLLDLVLKDDSGSNMARALKKNHPYTPIVILSAHNVTDVIEEADISFTKNNFDQKNFTSTIQGLLS